MAYSYSNQAQSPQMANQGWGGHQPTPPLSPYSNPPAPAAPPPTQQQQQQQPHYPAAIVPTPAIDAAALTPQLQPAYQAPQFAPLPVVPKVKPPSGVLNFFSFRPSYQVNTGESSLSVQASPPVHQYVAGPPAVYTQSPPVPPVPLPPLSTMPPYSPLTPAGQPGQAPVYLPQPPAFQQHYQQPQPQPQPQHHQPQPQPQPQYQHQHQPQHDPYDQPAPPAYSQGAGAAQKWPEKPTIQSNYAAAPAVPVVPAAAPVPAAPVPVAPPALKPQAPDETPYWAALVSQGTIPLAPKPQLRSLFRGIAACIIRECTVEAVPSCVLSPAQLSMYYGQYSGYGSRSARLFAHAQTAPHALSALYTRLAVEHVLLPSDPGDGRRRPDMPALTIRGFEHWLLLTALFDPDREYARLAAFIAAPGRRIQDDAGAVFPPGGFPRAALPSAPDAFVCRRYGAHLEEALTDESPPERDAGWRAEIDDLKKRLFERETELQKQRAEVDALRKEVAKQTAAAEEAVAKLGASVGVVQHQQRPSPPQQGTFSPQQQNPQNNPFFQYPQQQQNQYPPAVSPLSPPLPQQQQYQQQHPQQHPQQQYQHPPQPQRRQSEQPYPHDGHPQMQPQPQPQRRQTEQTAPPPQPTYSRPTYQPQR